MEATGKSFLLVLSEDTWKPSKFNRHDPSTLFDSLLIVVWRHRLHQFLVAGKVRDKETRGREVVSHEQRSIEGRN